MSSTKETQYEAVQGGETTVDLSLSTDGSQNLTYSWENLSVYFNIPTGGCISRLCCKKSPPIQKKILQNVTGAIRQGQVLAIMGASGAGKTTLLNCLTFRNSGNLEILGQRYLNKSPVQPDSLARISGYVQQNELFIGCLTVKELLRFQALLRMDKHLTYPERMDRVEEVIHELGLSKCANSVIGDPFRGIIGISGGERKRLAFACEVLTNPLLLFCDEPTSGLDSYTAQNIIEVIRNLASKGKTVILTVHQPSSEVFALFDRILLLSEGRTAFLGNTDTALEFFKTQGLECPSNFNPADFFIHNLAIRPGHEEDTKKKTKALCDAFEASDTGKQVAEMATENRPSAEKTDDEIQHPRAPLKRSPYKASWFTQFSAVLWRSWMTVTRERTVIRVKIFSTIFVAGLIALIFQGQETRVEDIMNINGALFILLTNITFQNVYAVVNTFAAEQPMFLREHWNGMYRTDVYMLAKMMAELPFHIGYAFLFVIVPYYPIGFNGAVDRFFISVAILIIVANVATSFGYFISCLSSSLKIASALSAPMIIPLLLFGGFFLNNGSVPVYFQWLRYMSWLMYGNEALSINQWQGIKFDNPNCNMLNGESDMPINTSNSTISVDSLSNATSSIPIIGQICTGEDILNNLNFNVDFFYRDIGCMFALMAGFRLLAYLALLRKTARK